MTKSFDLIVLGAGPAGASSAIEARKHGLSVAVVDENRRAGGQVYRAPSFEVPPGYDGGNPDFRTGEKLRSDLQASGADLLFGHTLWFAAPGVQIATVGRQGPQHFESKALIIAAGTSERIIPMTGSTLPGVIGLAAATILLKAHATVPSGPTVVAGVGPLIYAVAAGLVKSGGRIAAVVDLSGPVHWLSVLPGLISRPDLLQRGMGWMARLRRAGVPMRFGHTVVAVHGDEVVREVDIRPVDANWRVRIEKPIETFAADSVAIGHGLVPATETARSIGVPHEYRAKRGGWVPQVADNRSTAIKGIYIAGDCAGISGAAAAGFAGTLAGLTAARDIGALSTASYDRAARSLRADLRRAERFGWSISKLTAMRPGLAETVTQGTIVCRCEDVTRSTIDAAVANGAQHVNQLKSTTRCGMGPCQGRMCGEAAAELVALAAGVPRCDAGQWTARPPLRPVPLRAMLGDYNYGDIPKPPPLPA